MAKKKEHLKNMIQFYKLVNNLKYITTDRRQSIVDQIYGAITLCIAINSEYPAIESIDSTFRMILLGALNDHYHDELAKLLMNMSAQEQYKRDIDHYYESKQGRFAFDFIILEQTLTYFFEEFLVQEHIHTENIMKLYQIANSNGVIDQIGNDREKNYDIFHFYCISRILKKQVNDSRELTTVSEDIIDKIALACALYSECGMAFDLEQVILSIYARGLEHIKWEGNHLTDLLQMGNLKLARHKLFEIIGTLRENDKLVNLFFDHKTTEEAKIVACLETFKNDIARNLKNVPYIKDERNIPFQKIK